MAVAAGGRGPRTQHTCAGKRLGWGRPPTSLRGRPRAHCRVSGHTPGWGPRLAPPRPQGLLDDPRVTAGTAHLGGDHLPPRGTPLRKHERVRGSAVFDRGALPSAHHRCSGSGPTRGGGRCCLSVHPRRVWPDLVGRGSRHTRGWPRIVHSHTQHIPAQPHGLSCALSPSSNAPAHSTRSSAPWRPRDALSVLLQPTVELGNVKRRSRSAARASAFDPRCTVQYARFRVTFATGTLTNLHLRTAEGKFFAFPL